MKDSPNNTAFFDRTYDETVALLTETRDYVAAGSDRQRVSGVTALSASSELFRVTARLSQVMAWLLVRRAVTAGEIAEVDAVGEDYRLGGHEVCLDSAMHADQNLPPKVRSLLDRSYRLYQRVARLDELAARY